jgi:hypothetical protein
MSDSHRLLSCEFLKNLCVFVHPYSWPCNRLRLLISGSEVRALHGSRRATGIVVPAFVRIIEIAPFSGRVLKSLGDAMEETQRENLYSTPPDLTAQEPLR